MERIETGNIKCCPVCKCERRSPFLEGSVDQARLTGFSYASRKEPEFMNFPYVVCEECDLVYTPTPPTTEVLSAAYAEALYDSNEEAQYAARTYSRIMKPWINQLPRKSCAVDIGAGNGALLPFLKRLGFEKTIGIEPSSNAIAAAPKSIRSDIRQGLFSSDIIKDFTPDFICTSMTMEHVDSPVKLVSAAKDKLSKGGMLAIVVHNRRALLNRVLGKKSPIIDIEHLQLYSPDSLSRLFVEGGLEPLYVGNFWNMYPLRYWLRLSPFPTHIKRRLILAAQKLGCAKIPIPLPVGNMLGIARK